MSRVKGQESGVERRESRVWSQGLTLPKFLLKVLMLHGGLAQQIIIQLDYSVAEGKAF
jgi:hypothetical protein